MKYHSLKEIYYQDRERYRQVIHERTEDPVAVHTGLMFHPFDRHQGHRLVESVELFYLPINQLNCLIDRIYQNSLKILRLRADLPQQVDQQLVLNTMIEEIQNTNDIEGIGAQKKI